MGTKESCTCTACRDGCINKPGWFMPSEIEPLAKHLSLTIQEVFKQYLLIDYWVLRDEDDIFVISPCVTRLSPGGKFDWDAHGTCVFYQNERCIIHPVKPFECREAFHEGNDDRNHWKVAQAWQENQKFIEVITSEVPEEVIPTIGDLLDTIEKRFGFGGE